MPLTPLDFKVFGPKQFPAIRRAAILVQQHGRAATPVQFASQLRQHLLTKGIMAEWSDAEQTRLIVNQLVWVQIVGADQDAETARCHLRETMHQRPDVLMAYLLRISSPLSWRHIQISAKWMQPHAPIETTAVAYE